MSVFKVNAHCLDGRTRPSCDLIGVETLEQVIGFVDLWRDAFTRLQMTAEIDTTRERATVIGFAVWRGDRHVATLPGTSAAD